MSTFALTHQIEGSSPTINVGSNLPISISFTAGAVFALDGMVIPDNYSQATLWQTGQGNVTTFEFGLLISDVDLWVQLRNDDSGAAEYALIFVKANLPFYFGGKSGAGTTDRLDGAVLVDNTDYADVDQIQVQRDVADAVGDATVALYLFR